jgi:diguanylate cyclase (GGDEF)-like protein/putative nucleotidyltransferase with HDIG domain
MTEETLKPCLKYRLAFYLGGFLFATTSFLLGYYICGPKYTFSPEISFWEALWISSGHAVEEHRLALFVWQVICTVVAIALGSLLDREVYYRRKAEQRANVDGVTDIFNHRYFQDKLMDETERAGRYGRALSLIMLDLDDFKAFNDTWGHQEGDRLLKWFAETCTKCIRNIDTLARYGGEEFVVILPETDSSEALEVAERIRDITEKQSASLFANNKRITVSAGVASYPDHARSRHGLVLNADAAMYYAKRLGKNRCVVYDETRHRPYRASSGHVRSHPGDDDMDTIGALGALAEERHAHGKGHSVAVMQLAGAIGERLGLSAEELDNLRAAALLHDLGKLATPPELLDKSGPLDAQEWQKIEDHPKLGSKILKRVQQMTAIIPGVRHHHERYDGLGYPSGLAGENIPLFARIICIADAFDAMTNPRSYRNAMSIEEALEEIKRCSGIQFDPKLVEIMAEVAQDFVKERKAA